MLITDHILDDAKLIESPNYSDRLDESDIRLLVIHCISLPPKVYGNNYIEQKKCVITECDFWHILG